VTDQDETPAMPVHVEKRKAWGAPGGKRANAGRYPAKLERARRKAYRRSVAKLVMALPEVTDRYIEGATGKAKPTREQAALLKDIMSKFHSSRESVESLNVQVDANKLLSGEEILRAIGEVRQEIGEAAVSAYAAQLQNDEVEALREWASLPEASTPDMIHDTALRKLERILGCKGREAVRVAIREERGAGRPDIAEIETVFQLVEHLNTAMRPALPFAPDAVEMLVESTAPPEAGSGPNSDEAPQAESLPLPELAPVAHGPVVVWNREETPTVPPEDREPNTFKRIWQGMG
jgi:hypothetical protein